MPIGDDSSVLEMATDTESFARAQGRREQLERQQSQVLTEQMSSPRYDEQNTHVCAIVLIILF